MAEFSPQALVDALNAWPPEAVWALTLTLCFSGILLMVRLFGAAGLYVYIVVAMMGANVQVLKVVQFSVFEDPVALGTVLFASTYLCTDILAEYFGRAAARKAVWIGFAGFLTMIVFMMLGLGFAPLTPQQAGVEWSWALGVQDNISALFMPAPVLFVAGMAAYLVSQFHDVWMFRLIRRLTGGRFLWLRNCASTALSALIDNTIFSILAFIVLPAEALSWRVVIVTFIFGTWVLRLVVALADTPFVYLARWCLPRERTPAYSGEERPAPAE